MKKLGAALLLAGIIMLVIGINSSRSMESQVTRLFTGSPSNRTIYLLVGGSACCVFGAGLLFGKGR